MNRVWVAALATSVGIGCSDPPSSAPAGCAGLAMRVVIGPSPTRPGAGVRVFATSARGRSVEATTDAQGAACVDATDNDGVWNVTFARAGFGLTTLVGVPRAGVEGAVRIDAFVDTVPQPTVPISGHITSANGSGATWIVDVLDGTTVTAMSPDYMTRFIPGSDAPLLVSALELDAQGDAVRAALASAPRTTQAARVDVAFPTTDRVPIATTATIVPPTEGMLVAPSRVIAPPQAVQYHTASSDTAYIVVGSARVLDVASGGLRVAMRTFDGDLLPDGVYLGLLQPSPSLTLNLWVHEFVPTVSVRVSPVQEFSLEGDTLSSLRMRAVAPNYDAAEIVISRNRAPVPSWRIIPVTPTDALTLPPLPAGIIPSQHHLDDPILFAQGLLVKMWQGTPWSAPGYNISVPAFAYTVGGGFMPARNDLR